MKKGPYISNGLLIITLLISIIFKNKFIYIAPSLDVSIAILSYSFTFLILGYILTKYNYKNAKKAINFSIIIVLSFLILTNILCIIPSNISSLEIQNSLRNIFTPNSIKLFGNIFYYIDLTIIIILLIYFLTHNIFISISDVLNTLTNKYIGFGISLFIAFIIDTMFMVPILHIKDIYYSSIETLDVIKYLTANFIVLIITSLLLLLIYTLIFQKKKNN